jgi:hypothetical protein
MEGHLPSTVALNPDGAPLCLRGVFPDCWVEEAFFELTEMSFDLHRWLR